MELSELLLAVKAGSVSPEEALQKLQQGGCDDHSFARLDFSRARRRGRPETIFCQGKSIEQLRSILGAFKREKQSVLGSRATQEQYEALKTDFPELVYDTVPRLLRMGEGKTPKQGLVVVCSGGTADLPVAEEAAQCAEFFGSNVRRCFDVGIAGIHRLFAQVELLRQANAVIAVAGMEGALGTVIAGLVDVPVIAVPTSVGYGASFQGLAPLLTMLNSCAEGLMVVNIDNGFGAGYAADQINRLAVRGRTESGGTAEGWPGSRGNAPWQD